MSTRLLSSVGGSVHELNDDLESHFFVLLFEGLHFVEHNKPNGIYVDAIFDQVHVNSETGNHYGGQGKGFLYAGTITVMNNLLEFTSKPFTTLIRGLYRLFATLFIYHAVKNRQITPNESDVGSVGELEGCVGVVALFEEALRSEEWPTECDKVLDQYPSTELSEPEQKDTVALSHFRRSLAPVLPNGKRKRETEGEIGRSRGDKQIKMGPPR